MIRIDVFRNKDGKISEYRVCGHSGTAERGRDIVCAGISSLAQTALLGLGEHLHRDMDYSVDPSGGPYIAVGPNTLSLAIGGEIDINVESIKLENKKVFLKILKLEERL